MRQNNQYSQLNWRCRVIAPALSERCPRFNSWLRLRVFCFVIVVFLLVLSKTHYLSHKFAIRFCSLNLFSILSTLPDLYAVYNLKHYKYTLSIKSHTLHLTLIKYVHSQLPPRTQPSRWRCSYTTASLRICSLNRQVDYHRRSPALHQDSDHLHHIS